jgi:adenylate cyclase
VESSDRSQLRSDIERRLNSAGIAANLCGAIDLFAFGALLMPDPGDVDRGTVVLVNAIVFVPYMAITLTLGGRWIGRLGRPLRAWFETGRAPTPEERDYALRLPLLGARITATFWGVAAIIFTALNLVVAPRIAPAIPVIMFLGAITTTTVDYLLSERILRPVTAQALVAGLPARPAGPGVQARVVIVWAAATGSLLFGIGATAVAGLLDDTFDRDRLLLSILFLAVFATVVGLAATRLSARALAEPLAAVRHALERVEGGDLSAEVPVDDGSELGLVEAGFNRMVAGLRERERLRDVFGRHVGRDVARAALEGDVKLGGEVRDVGALFVDVIASTALAEMLAPERVVTLLNEFFAIVVAVTEAHGGAVNKFEGDGAVCVFGAPVSRDDPAAAALAAAREMRARLLDELPQVDAAIGVSAGAAVAGNVGAEQRFEYTVIGDPVNEAARLCELAKLRPERVIASDAALQRADPREAARWALGEATVLRGRQAPTRIATVGGP